MDAEKVKVLNEFGEQLDVLIEGNENANEVIVFVHGYGTDKDEGFATFVDLSNAFRDTFLNIRYDQAGYGQSEGKDVEFHLQKASGDLRSILRWVSNRYQGKKINIIAHSLGVFITLLLSPHGVERCCFSSIPNTDTKYVSNNLKARIKEKLGGEINEDGVTTYKRSRGGVQLIGKDFWRTLENMDPVKLLEELVKDSKVFIFKPLEDDVLGEEHFDEYKSIAGVQYIELHGDHNFTDLADREVLIKEMRKALNS